MSDRGDLRERELRDGELARCGWFAVRAAGSMGPVDLVAIATDQAWLPWEKNSPDGPHLVPAGSTLFLECKGTSRPFERFGPAARAKMLELGNLCATPCVLAWRPKHARHWTWIESSDWPDSDRPGPRYRNRSNDE